MQTPNAHKLGLAAFLALTGAASLPLAVAAQTSRDSTSSTLEASDEAVELVADEGSGEGSGESVQLRVREAEHKAQQQRRIERDREANAKR